MKARLHLLRSVLQTFVADYLRLAEPDAAACLDLERLRFLDLPNELDHPEPGLGFAAEVPQIDGDPVTALVRIESEAPMEDEVTPLLGRCLAALGIVYGRPLLIHFLSLKGARPGPHLETAVVARVAGIEAVRVFYTHFGLRGARAEYYLERPEPLAWALAAWMRPVKHDPADLWEACRKRIAASGLPDPQRALLLDFVEAAPDDQ